MKKELPPRQAVKLALPPPGRARYTTELDANMEILVSCPAGMELCGGRIAQNEFRVWTREKKSKP